MPFDGPSFSLKPPPGAEIDREHPLARGLVGCWLANDGGGTVLHDYSGHKNHGTLTNMDPATDWVMGERGLALDFDGSNDRIDAGNGSSLNISTQSVTIAVWVNTTSTGFLVDKARIGVSPGDGGYSLYLRSTDPYVRMTVQDNASNFIHQSGSSVDIRDGVWHHVVGQWDFATQTVRTYVDAVLTGETTGSGISSLSEADGYPLTIGARYNAGSPDNHFGGEIGDVQLYYRLLSFEEIHDHYRASYSMFQGRPRLYFAPPEGGTTVNFDAAGETWTGATFGVNSGTGAGFDAAAESWAGASFAVTIDRNALYDAAPERWTGASFGVTAEGSAPPQPLGPLAGILRPVLSRFLGDRRP